MSYYNDEIQKLTEQSRKLICFIGYWGKNVTVTILENFAKDEGIGKTSLNEEIGKLIESGMCSQEYSYVLTSHFYIISEHWYLPVLKFILMEHPEWETQFRKYNVVKDAVFAKLFLTVKKFFKDKSKGVSYHCTSSQFSTFAPYLYPAAYDRDLHPLVNILPLDCIVDYFKLVSVNGFYADVVDTDNAIPTLLKSYDFLPREDYKEIQELLALYRYYSLGEFQPVADGTTMFHFILLGVRSLHQRQYAEAGIFLDKALKLRNKLVVREKDIFMNVLTCYFLIAYYLHDATSKNKKKLEQFCKRSELHYCESLWPAYVVAQQGREDHNIDISTLKQIHSLGMGISGRVFKAMANYLTAVLEVPLGKEYSGEYMPSHAILAHEFQMYLPLDDQTRKELNEKFGTPVLFPEPPIPRWEQILNDLVKRETESADEPADTPQDERLAYLIQGSSIQVRDQKRKLNGLWGVGKVVSSYQYYEGAFPFMDEIDRQIWTAHGKRLDNLSVSSVLPFLVGSDKVCVGFRAPYSEVTVEKEEPYLIIDSTKQNYVVTSNLPRLTESLSYVVQKTPVHYVVVHKLPEQKEIFKRLLDVRIFPLAAESKLRAALAVLGQKIQIHSPLLENENSLQTLSGTGKIALQIKKATNYKFDICLVARPIADGKDVFYPGCGESIVIMETTDGNRVKVKRRLKEEQANMEALNAFIEDLMEGFVYDRRGNDATWVLSMYFMLDVLEYVGEHSELYTIEWPEGEKISLRKIPERKEWNLELKPKGGGWFDLEGNVQIDEHTVIDIAKLLEIVSKSGTRNFVSLSPTEYLKLTSEMRKKLEYLEALAVREKNQLRIPKMNSLLLNETMDGDLAVSKNKQLQEIISKIKSSYDLNPRSPRSLQATLRDYQLEGFRWMVRLDSWGAGSCLADDMGLGKTVQTIALLLYKAKQGPSLVIAPTSVVTNWRTELARFAPLLQVALLNELDADERAKVVREAKDYDVIISSYGIVCSESKTLDEKDWNVICLDEAHAIKNRETKTAQQIYELKGSTRVALTGTPLQNHLGELWSLFNFINPGMLGSYDSFRQKFVTPIENGDKERQKQLRRMVLPFILRRTKTEVIEELPDKTEIMCRVSLSSEEMQTYELIRTHAEQRLDAEERVSVAVLAEITKLRQAACASGLVDENLDFKSSKIERMLQLVDEIREGGNRVLIFSQFTSFLKMVKDALDEEKMEYLYLDGSTPLKQRQNLVHRFQEGEGDIFIISLKAGGLGLNLTGANYVIHMDPWWNPAIEQQATDRVYRIGQNQKVTVYHLIAEHTIEEKILRLHKSKRDMSDSLLAGADLGHKLTEEDLRKLLAR